jgi:hypothetical protein
MQKYFVKNISQRSVESYSKSQFNDKFFIGMPQPESRFPLCVGLYREVQ